MSEYVTGINPQVLKWARLKAGIHLNEIALRLKKDPKIIENWETGESAPTYIQLESLAYKYYKRPIALFFFPEPPEELDLEQSFRTLPDFELEKFDTDTIYAIRQGTAMQLALKELNDGINRSERLIANDLKIKPSEDIIYLSEKIREYLGISLDQQILWKSNTDALANWRNAVENAGIYIFKRSFKQKDVSGFCLLNDQFPIIYLNNSTAKSRQIFTIFHELAHILLSTNGITKTDIEYINALKGENRAIEIFCNRFAGEFLVPSTDFKFLNQSVNTIDEEFIRTAAERYCVSREVILRKLHDKKLIDDGFYHEKVQEWIKDYKNSRQGGKGGDYYANQLTYLGENYTKLAFTNYYQGKFGIEQLADYLNVRVKSIPGLEQRMLSR